MILDLILRYALGGRQHGFTLLVARVSLLGMVLGVAQSHCRFVGDEWFFFQSCIAASCR